MAQQEFFRLVIYLWIAFLFGIIFMALEQIYLGIPVVIGFFTMIWFDWHMDFTWAILILLSGGLWFGSYYGPIFGDWRPNFWTKRILKPAVDSSTHVAEPIAARTRASKKTY